MARYHGVTENTYKRFVIDSGAVYKGYVNESNRGDLIGATRGGNTFTIETEYKDMTVDGAKGMVKGGRRITRVTATLVANYIEIYTDLILRALPGSSETLVTNHDKITRSLQLDDDDYMSNVALIGEVSDGDAVGPAVFVINNPLIDSNFEAALTDAEEVVIPVTYSAHFASTDLDTEPWEILWPHDSNPTTTTTA